MLTELLRAVSRGRPSTLEMLAAELGTDPHGVRVAFDYCERLGYLERSATGCPAGSCAGCTLRCPAPLATDGNAAANPVAPVWWRITDRGARALTPSPEQRVGRPSSSGRLPGM